jgi:hypothetical protein
MSSGNRAYRSRVRLRRRKRYRPPHIRYSHYASRDQSNPDAFAKHFADPAGNRRSCRVPYFDMMGLTTCERRLHLCSVAYQNQACR